MGSLPWLARNQRRPQYGWWQHPAATVECVQCIKNFLSHYSIFLFVSACAAIYSFYFVIRSCTAQSNNDTPIHAHPHNHTLTHPHLLSLSHSHWHALTQPHLNIHTYSLVHTRTPIHSHALSLTPTHSHTHARTGYFPLEHRQPQQRRATTNQNLCGGLSVRGNDNERGLLAGRPV